MLIFRELDSRVWCWVDTHQATHYKRGYAGAAVSVPACLPYAFHWVTVCRWRVGLMGCCSPFTSNCRTTEHQLIAISNLLSHSPPSPSCLYSMRCTFESDRVVPLNMQCSFHPTHILSVQYVLLEKWHLHVSSFDVRTTV
jgi:hypothetical protein